MSKLHDQPKFRIPGASDSHMGDTEVCSKPKPLRTVGEKQVLGWKEFVALPDFGEIRLLAKLDTGARTSALHAGNLTFSRSHAKLWVEFDLPDFHAKVPRRFKLPVVEHRKIKSSIGNSQIRPVVLLALHLADQTWTTEVTLTDRSDMELPMLIGRSALRGRFVVDPARTRLASQRQLASHPMPARKSAPVSGIVEL